MKLTSLSYTRISSAWGAIGVAWQEADEGSMICRIYLPNETIPGEAEVHAIHAERVCSSHAAIAEWGKRLQAYMEGEIADFPLDRIALEVCSEFQQKVLLAQFGVPRGRVSTYGGIARALGIRGGARAVGGALSRNPFPILIPCHRTVRSDGGLGGFRGGLEMKRALLQLEGVKFSPKGKVPVDRIWEG